MFDDLIGAYGSRFLLAAGGVGIALLLLVVVLLIIRSRAPSPFVRGGRNRQPRLQVLDAAAVDARRRLVLVRRDDVEHLVMIGGPTDIVIESRILPRVESEAEPARVPAAEQKEQPVMMIADADPVAPPAPKPAMARSPAPVEEYVPEPAAIKPTPVPEPRQPAEAAAVEGERSPRPVPSSAPSIEPRPQQQTFASRESPPIEASAAAEILDSARQRVLTPQRVEPQLIRPANRHPAAMQPSTSPAVNPIGAPAAPPSAQPSDFQRVLEEEMTSTLAAERIVPAQTAPIRPLPGQGPGNLPRRDPEMAPITGADAALQNEVARIFGEMSVNRDK
ncbi:flagellar biosynthesis protein FliO [Rhizobium sp. Root1203]|uniref:flagellar biosynthetic protein FliO n=1 Tax=Rhizobium sp. Root1203 TaxID=1736427 RepID=UPI00070E9BCB|nr:flagellar biosynthetic protein FliO [Rhizobium sp. Root1203]KQV27707.1 flagellar biosynthesis protein FliO [Rhizobium sp. Root1203]